jgi:MFS transporter, DHA2 family, methylenomycin A resistance protein
VHISERLAIAAAALSFFISTLDLGIVNVALPQLTRSLHIGASLGAWTISAYAVALSITILPFGRLGDRFGVVRMSVIGFALFALFSIGCTLAPTIAILIVFRALTGIAAAMLQGTAASFVSRYVQGSRRGQAFGWVSAVLSLGAVLGPSIGGFVVTFASWRWIFLAVVPFALAGLVAAGMLRDVRSVPPGDVESARERPRGIARATPFVVAGALGATFIAVFVGSPFELTREAHLPAWEVGLVMLATPLGAAFAARLTGTLVQRGLGVASMVAGLAVDGAAALGLLATPATSLGLFAALLFLFGLGSGAMQTPAIALSLAAFPARQQSTAGALQRFVQNLTISGSAALSGVFIDHLGPQSVWIFTAAVAFATILIVAMLTAFSRPTRARRSARGPASAHRQ